MGKENEENQNKIRVIVVEPDKYPKVTDIDDSLENMQKIVGGDIEEYLPFDDDAAIVCNEEGKFTDLKPNRAVYSDDKKKEVSDVIYGTFFICNAPYESERFESLTPEMTDRYTEMFKYPERFEMANGRIKAVPFRPESVSRER